MKLNSKLDQHLIINSNLVKRLISYVDVQKDDVVLEIGPGTGVITEQLCTRAKEVRAYEIDMRLEHKLNLLEQKYNNLQIIYQNALDAEFPYFDKIVANSPFSISEQLLTKLINYDFSCGVLIVNKSLAETIVEKQRRRISILANSHYAITVGELIPPSAFYPRPKAHSAVITFAPKTNGNSIVNYLWQRREKTAGELLLRNTSTKLSRKILLKSVERLTDVEFDKVVKQCMLASTAQQNPFINQLPSS